MNIEKIKNKLKPIVYPIINFIPRRRLKNKNFTIICDNCWAGKVYQELANGLRPSSIQNIHHICL